LKTLVAVVTLVQFFAASAVGSCIITWREIERDISVPAACCQTEAAPVQTCCGLRPVRPVERSNVCRDRTLVVWSILLSLNPSIVPCCADVSLAPQLSDFCERYRAFDHSPDMALAEPVLIDTTVQQPVDFFSCSDPQGLPPPVSITILRC